MKRSHGGSTAAKSRGGIRWDEGNLAANEAVKATLPPVKIPEAKTPYAPPLDSTTLSDLGADRSAAHFQDVISQH